MITRPIHIYCLLHLAADFPSFKISNKKTDLIFFAISGCVLALDCISANKASLCRAGPDGCTDYLYKNEMQF